MTDACSSEREHRQMTNWKDILVTYITEKEANLLKI